MRRISDAYAVILAGGRSERLWPKADKTRPKFLFEGPNHCSLLEETMRRLNITVPRKNIFVVTNKVQAPYVRQCISIDSKNLIFEPFSRNTAAAIGLAAVYIGKINPDAIMIVSPTDHYIPEVRKFATVLRRTISFAKNRPVLLAIGIKPNFPATSFGYIKMPKAKFKRQIFKVDKFIEKPPLKTAKRFVKSKDYLWNSGIFVWRVRYFLDALKKYQPSLYNGLKRLEKKLGKPGFHSSLQKEYKNFKDLSIDYGLLERADNVYAQGADFFWKDFGNWNSLFDVYKKDTKGNLIRAAHAGIDTQDSIIFSDEKHLIGTIGVSGLIIVHTPNATLVCAKDRAEDVKKMAHMLNKKCGY